jgi:hypothetical protein
MSKRQGTIESSVFGAEFVAMKVGLEAARGLRYKLRMMGIQVTDPVLYILGDNMSVIHNTLKPESVLKKKSNSIYVIISYASPWLWEKVEQDMSDLKKTQLTYYALRSLWGE